MAANRTKRSRKISGGRARSSAEERRTAAHAMPSDRVHDDPATVVSSRRGVLLGAVSALAAAPFALSPLPAKAQESAEGSTGDGGAKPSNMAEDVRRCARIVDLELTEREAAQIAGTLESNLGAIRALRGLDLENELAPATVFDPRLPGRSFPAQKNRGVRGLKPDHRRIPSNEDDIAFASLADLGHWIRTRQISSRELTELYLKRIERHDPLLLAFVTVTADLARSQAAARDEETAKGRIRGPLHGIPYGLKDLMDTAGIRTTWGAMPYKDRVAERDAAVVEKLEAAGAVLLGKTTDGAIAYGDIWFGGRTRNPWNPLEGSSGSSAGSASATAAGLVGFSIGTETLGSIVSPSNRCGATGLRPTFGRVSRHGAMALCWSLDKLGPICRHVADTALVLAAINGHDPRDPGSLDHGFEWDARDRLDGLTVGWSPAWFERADETDRAALEALKRLPVKMKEVALPDWPYAALYSVVEAEAAAAFQELTLSGRDDLMVWQEDRAWPNTWRRAHFLPAPDFINAQRFRRRVMTMMSERLDEAGIDAFFSPNYAGWLLVITNFTGHPCLTLPAGFRELPTRTGFGDEDERRNAPRHRVPQNVTLWGPLFEERRLLTLGRALESALGLARGDALRPPLARWMKEYGGRAPKIPGPAGG